MAAKTSGKKKEARRKPTFLQRVATFFGVLTTLILLVILGVVGVVNYFFYTAKPPDQLIEYSPSGRTEIFATDKDPKTGKNVLLATIYLLNKQFVPITEIPDTLKNATVAIEDERFFTHPGVDLRGISRALYRDVRGGRMGEGGSTLTQQLARNIYLNNRRTINRKIQEMLLAIQIERNYSKEQILEMYLNEVYYGSNAYGVDAAAQVYFGCKPKDLTLPQAALIAGLPQRPNDLSPFQDPDGAIARRNLVLTKMEELHYITHDQAKAAISSGLRLAPVQQRNQSDVKAPYFVEYIKSQLVDRYGYDAVYKTGLKVYTTLNWKMQQEAEGALINGVLKANAERVSDGALVCIEPRTGYIRAMVGGMDFKKNQFNNAAQGRRQPGSSFKAFVYTAAFASHKFGLDSEVTDEPVSFPDGSGKVYRPQNYGGGGYHYRVSLREAIVHSYNIPAVVVTNTIGPKRVIEYARKMGITSDLEPNLSIALGSYPVSPLEMASAYSVFPNDGSHARPMSIIRVIDHEGTVQINAPQVDKAVVPESTIAQMSDVLGEVVERGTASSAAGIHEIEHAHGKTGTTNENKDAWFVGYTPELCTSVWICGVRRIEKDGRLISRYIPMEGVTGGHVAAPIWARFMKAAIPIQRHSGEPIAPLPEKIAPKLPKLQDTNQPNAADAASKDFTKAALVTAPAPPKTDTPKSPATTPPGFQPTAAIVPAPPSLAPNIGQGQIGSPTAPPRVAPVTPTRLPSGSRPTIAVASVTRTDRSLNNRTRLDNNRRTEPRPASSVATVAPALVEPRLPPRPVVPPPPALVSVEVCPDSGMRATRWCPERVTRQFPANRAPKGRCRIHRPRPGDG